MKTYEPEQIRNIAIVGHSESGKTTFTESAAVTLGLIQRMGSVANGTTISDFNTDEIAKKISINSSVIHGFWKDCKINLLDTPGYIDFIGDVKSAVRVSDTVVVCVSAVSGVEVGTESVWDIAAEMYKPTIFMITKLDRDHSDFNHAIQQLHEYYGHYVVPVQFPIDEGINHKTIVDCLSMKAYIFEPGKNTPMQVADIPERYVELADSLHQDLVETVAETDEDLLNTFFESGSLSEEQLKDGIKHGLLTRTFFPVFCCSPELSIGTERMLDVFTNLCPSPIERGPEHAVKIKNSEDFLVQPDINGKSLAFIFKTTSEPHLGEMSFFRVYSGHVQSGQDFINEETGQEERLSQIYTLVGHKRIEVDKLLVGDIGAVVKLKKTHTNNTLAEAGIDYTIRPVGYPEPCIRTAIMPLSKNDETKIGSALFHLHEEDPSFRTEVDPELHQTLLYGQGEIHLETIINRLKEKFGVSVEMVEPKIPYRESLKGATRIQGKYKKQSGGRGQYGDVWLRIEPLKRGEGFVFVDEVVGGVVPGKFIPSVEKGLVEIMERGVVSGNKVVDVKVTIDDGSHHPVDSSDMAFKMAAILGFKRGFEQAKPIILEPIYTVAVKTPDEYMGDVLGDISSRRGKVLGVDADGHWQIVRALIPLSELYKYQSMLRGMTHGRGTHSLEFSAYEEVPYDISLKLMSAYKQNLVEEE